MVKMICAALSLAAILQPASGHSYLAAPAARNTVAAANAAETCPHCLQAGGPSTVSSRAGGVWPSNTVPESHGLCGDPVQNVAVAADWRTETYLTPTAIQATYTAGQIVEFVIAISTHHMGHYEFKLCNKIISGETLSSRAEGQACLDAVVLERAPLDSSCTPNNGDADCQPIDPNHPGRWYLPPGGQGSSPSEAPQASFPYGVGEVHKMRYKIPDDFSCDACTLQWYWSTGNSCLYDGDYFDYFRTTFPDAGWSGASGWCPWCPADWANCQNSCCGVQRGFGEEFWNCADIRVEGSGSAPSPTPTPTPAPSTSIPASTSSSGAANPPSCSSLGVCDKLNNTFMDTGCAVWNGDESGCSGSFITHGQMVVPCEWMACSAECLAKGAAMLPCAEDSLTCGCTSIGAWSNAQCRSWCHSHPSFCNAECQAMCGDGCSCNDGV